MIINWNSFFSVNEKTIGRDVDILPNLSIMVETDEVSILSVMVDVLLNIEFRQVSTERKGKYDVCFLLQHSSLGRQFERRDLSPLLSRQIVEGRHPYHKFSF